MILFFKLVLTVVFKKSDNLRLLNPDNESLEASDSLYSSVL